MRYTKVCVATFIAITGNAMKSLKYNSAKHVINTANYTKNIDLKIIMHQFLRHFGKKNI